jgi:hypothetical protein
MIEKEPDKKVEEKATVVVSRKWRNPNIKLAVSVEGLGISMDLNEFIKAMCVECGNPALLLTVSHMEKRMIEASKKVVTEMKQESVRIL